MSDKRPGSPIDEINTIQAQTRALTEQLANLKKLVREHLARLEKERERTHR